MSFHCLIVEAARPGHTPCEQQCPSCASIEPAVVPGFYTSELSTGQFLDLSDPDPELIAFQDIAYGLSKECRYNGQCSGFMSVAEHTMLVAYRLAELRFPVKVVLAGLHHDDSEALTCDIPRPLKKLLGDAYTVVEDRVFAAVTEALGISELPFDHPAVKEADDWALQREAFELMPSRGEHWFAALRHPGGPAPWRLGASPQVAMEGWVRTNIQLVEMLA